MQGLEFEPTVTQNQSYHYESPDDHFVAFLEIVACGLFPQSSENSKPTVLLQQVSLQCAPEDTAISSKYVCNSVHTACWLGWPLSLTNHLEHL